MRVISGTAGGHRLTSVAGIKTRPTADRVKESLFNIISNRTLGAIFLDLFAGNGGIGIEALSRGANNVVFIDNNPKCGQTIKANLAKTKLKGEVYIKDAFSALETLKRYQRCFDLIFLDPPYQENLVVPALQLISKYGLLEQSGLLIAEYGKKEEIPQSVLNLTQIRIEQYGDTVLGFYCYEEDLGED